MSDRSIEVEKAQNLWTSFVRKFEPLMRSTQITANSEFDFERIGGLAGPKDEILTYACAATDPEVYSRWGTEPPSGILLIGDRGVGKNLLARALATNTQTSFVRADVPRLVLDVVHSSGKVGELIQGWTQVLEEIPPLTLFFDELEFSQAQEIGALRADLAVGPIMDFLLEMIDRAIAADHHLVVGSTSHPDTLRQAFVNPGRFERVVEVTPIFPDDVVEVLQIHATASEKRAGRPVFDVIDWRKVVGHTQEASPADWVRVLHAVLRSKARCEAAGENPTPVTTEDVVAEVERFKQALRRIRTPSPGNYV